MRERPGRWAALVAVPLALGLILPVATQAAGPQPLPLKSQGIAVKLREQEVAGSSPVAPTNPSLPRNRSDPRENRERG